VLSIWVPRDRVADLSFETLGQAVIEAARRLSAV
jgi:hypothetical protein